MLVQLPLPGRFPILRPAPTQGPASPAARPQEAPPEDRCDKLPSQQLGDVGVGATSLGSVSRGLASLAQEAAHSRAARHVPGLNLGVATLEDRKTQMGG